MVLALLQVLFGIGAFVVAIPGKSSVSPLVSRNS